MILNKRPPVYNTASFFFFFNKMMFKTNRLDELILPLVNTTETNSSVETKPEILDYVPNLRKYHEKKLIKVILRMEITTLTDDMPCVIIESELQMFLNLTTKRARVAASFH